MAQATFSVVVFLLVYFTMGAVGGNSLGKTEEESMLVNELLQHLSHAQCDMIMVSWSAIYGEILQPCIILVFTSYAVFS